VRKIRRNRIKTEKGVDVKTSSPIVVYRETIQKISGKNEGRSPNKHNIFFLTAEPLADNIYEAIKSGALPEGRIKKKNEQLWKQLSQLGVSNDEARQYRNIFRGNVFLDQTRGEVHIGEVIDMIMDAFEQVVNAGPLAKEPCMKMKICLVDTKLHEDAIHRGPAQVYPAVRDAMKNAMAQAGATLYEPVQVYAIEAPTNFMSEVTKLVTMKRGQLLGMSHEGTTGVIIKAKIPVAEMIGWASDLRSATEGRGVSSLMDQMFEKVPASLLDEVLRKIRQRKGIEHEYVGG